ncbi:MAG: DUF485 domain-containing protein [Pseudomonadales bacterium]
MTKDHQLAVIQRRTRRRFSFAAVALCLYFSFALVWTDFGSAMSKPLGDTPINAALLMFISLIVIFISMEFLFLRISNRETSEEESAASDKEREEQKIEKAVRQEPQS